MMTMGGLFMYPLFINYIQQEKKQTFLIEFTIEYQQKPITQQRTRTIMSSL